MDKMKKVLVFLSLIMVFAVMVDTPGYTKDGGVLKFRMSSHYPPDNTSFWVDKVEKATNGRVKIIVYANSSLIGLEDTLTGLKDGIADIALVPCEIFPEAYPLNNVLILPFLPLGDQRKQYRIWHELQDKFPELKAEWSRFQVLYDDTTEGNVLHTVKSTVKTPKDLDGLRMFAAGKVLSDVVESAGAIPLYLEVPDWFTSLDRGLLDGMLLPWDAVYELKIYPLLPYHTSFNSAPGMMMKNALMKLGDWNRIPADIQKIILDIAPEQLNHQWQTIEMKNKKTIEAIKSSGGTIVDLSPEEVDEWFKLALPLHKAYLAKVDGMGLPATKLYEEALRLANEFPN